MDEPLSSHMRTKRLGVLVGGSGLIGGTLMHYFKTRAEEEFDILAPNSKRLSLREPEDIRRYFKRFTPDFIINAAIAAIDSDPLMAMETNFFGTVHLARAALELGVPYIHFSSAAVLPEGENLTEEMTRPLTADLANYPKSKLLAELALEKLGKKGLDYTNIRLAIVYGEHDHKIQGFQRLLFALASGGMPFLFTRPGVFHSYSNARKLPSFVHHVLNRREEFSRQTFHFADPLPVALDQLILAVKHFLELKTPREIYLPYPVAKNGMKALTAFVRLLARLGLEARMPAELLFLKNFYQTQTLSVRKLALSSYIDPEPETTVFTELPNLIRYYLPRWEHLNLIGPKECCRIDPYRRETLFVQNPSALLAEVDRMTTPFLHQESDGHPR